MAVSGEDSHFPAIDAELVSIDAAGLADFATLRRTVSKRQEDGLALWAFDLLFARGRDIRATPYIERKKRLASLLARADIGVVSHSEFFARPTGSGTSFLIGGDGTPGVQVSLPRARLCRHS